MGIKTKGIKMSKGGGEELTLCALSWSQVGKCSSYHLKH